jgi:hypothetical protein
VKGVLDVGASFTAKVCKRNVCRTEARSAVKCQERSCANVVIGSYVLGLSMMVGVGLTFLFLNRIGHETRTA